jgi:hypothetical protein
VNRGERRRARHLHQTIAEEWRRADCALGLCASCSRDLPPGKPTHDGEAFIPNEGIVLFRLCGPCKADMETNMTLREHIVREATRSLCGAGPDDVKGSA